MQHSISVKMIFKSMTLIHFALVTGLLIFTGMAYFVISPSFQPDSMNTESFYELFRYLIPGVAILAILAGRFIGNQLLNVARQKEDLAQKLTTYRTSAMLRWSLMEGAGFFAVIAYILTGNQVFILVALAAAAYLFTQKPTATSIGRELALTNSEIRELD